MIRSAWFYLCCRTQGTRAARLPTSGWVMHSPIFNKHTCLSICINARVSIVAQVSAHIHLLCLWDTHFPFKAALWFSSRAVAFATWLVLHGSTFRLRKTHRLCRRKRPQNLIRWPACADPQLYTSLVQLAYHFCVTQTNVRREKMFILLFEL